MKTSTTIKIIFITFLMIVSKVSIGQAAPGQVNEVKKPTLTVKKNTSVKPQSLAGSKRGILPTMTVTTVSKTYLV